MPTAKQTTRTLLLVAAWVSVLAYAWSYLDRGWVPHDEGTLAFSAERVLEGQLPHLDYDEVYTGGLAFAGAAAFRIFGTDLFTLRLILFAVFAVWIPVVYWCARRFATPAVSGVVTLLSAAWSIPAYSAAVPSWFNLFFSCFAVAGLLRYLEVPQRRWLLAAGVAAGVSILAKVVGLYLVAGCLLSLAFLEQSECAAHRESEAGGGRLYSAFITLAGLALTLLVWGVVRSVMELVVFLNFVLPVALVTGWLIVREWHLPPTIALARARRLAALAVPFVVGLSLPLVLFAIPFGLRGGLDELFRGVFVEPMARIDFARIRPPQARTLLNVVPVVAVLAASWRLPHERRLRIAGLLAVLAVVLLTVGSHWRVYPRVWFSVRGLIPVVTLCGVAVLWASRPQRTREGRHESSSAATQPRLREDQAVILLAVTALAGLVQFPFTSPVYFLYVAPLVAMTVLAVVAACEDRPSTMAQPEPPRIGMRSRPVFTVVFAFYLGFAVLWIHPGFVYAMGRSFLRDDQTASIDLERSSLRVSADDKRVYETLIGELQSRAETEFILATPDAPEVYFLSGLSSPSRSTFEFFDEADPQGTQLLAALDSTGVSVIALNQHPDFSPRVGGDLRRELERRFPREREIGKFILRWRK